MFDSLERTGVLQDGLKEEMAALRSELKGFRHDLARFESRMTVRFGVMLSIAIVIVVAILKLT